MASDDDDDDITIVGTIEPEIMSHNRSDCPAHAYVTIQEIKQPPHAKNVNFCPKCYCYICDKLAKECEKWTDQVLPHCNANPKSSCWKARRNMNKTPLLSELSAEEITPEIQAAGVLSIQFIVEIREAYFTYKKGIPCESCLVPCQCHCHNHKQAQGFCSGCKAIHDTNKEFNYAPVQNIVIKFFNQVQNDYVNDPSSALVLYDAILSEVCTHRPADFNHVLKMPSNPKKENQCRTPQLLDSYFDWELMKLFVLNDIDVNFRKKFIRCVVDAIAPLQIDSILKRFLNLRHWNDLLLRAVLSGQNVSGKVRGDVLRELPFVVEHRVSKLMKEKRYLAVSRYLNVIKILKTEKSSPYDRVATNPIIETWMIESLIMRGKFREACLRFVNKLDEIRHALADRVLQLFSLMSGKNVPPEVGLVDSFSNKSSATYEIEGIDKTILLLLYLVYYHVANSQCDFSYLLWIAAYVNEKKVFRDPSFESDWFRQSEKIIALGRRFYVTPDMLKSLKGIEPLSPQAAILVCSSVLAEHFTRRSADLKRITEVTNLYEQNEWGLFYVFSNPTLFVRGNSFGTKWLTQYIKKYKQSLFYFDKASFAKFLSAVLLADVCAFMNEWISPSWTIKEASFIGYFLYITASYASRIIREISFRRKLPVAFDKTVIEDVVRGFTTLTIKPEWNNNCELIAKACSYVDISNVDWCFDIVHSPGAKANQIAEVIGTYIQKFKRNFLSATDIAKLFRQAVRHTNTLAIETIINDLALVHSCSKLKATNRLIMDTVIENIGLATCDSSMTKRDLVMLYTQLCINDTLSWLICPNCSIKMSDHWANFWIALSKNGLESCLQHVVDQTFQVYSGLLLELSISKDDETFSLIKCMNTFLTVVVDTLVLKCSYNADELKEKVLKTRNNIKYFALSTRYYSLICLIFSKINDQEKSSDSLPSIVAVTSNSLVSKVDESIPGFENELSSSNHQSNNKEMVKTDNIIKRSCKSLKRNKRDIDTEAIIKVEEAATSFPRNRSIASRKHRLSNISVDDLVSSMKKRRTYNNTDDCTKQFSHEQGCSTWNIPPSITIPSDFRVTVTCTVHLSLFPRAMMEKIHSVQPQLNLKALYA